MFKLRLLLLAVLVMGCTPFFAAQRPKPVAYPDLPPGPMQATARTACTECHDEHIIVQQRLSKDAWTKDVDKMIRWGTLLDPKDRDPLIEYLSTNFPQEKMVEPPARVAKKK